MNRLGAAVRTGSVTTFDHAPPGMLGLEYALALAFTELVDGGTGMTEADVLAVGTAGGAGNVPQK